MVNNSSFSDVEIDSILGTAARFLLRQHHEKAAHLLANSEGRIEHWEHDNWNGGFDTYQLSLEVPAEVYFDLDDRETLEGQINSVLRTAMQTLNDIIKVKIITQLDSDPNWRVKVNRHLQGDGITNQGRVRSDNVATRQHDGLLFRSGPEVLFYNALKRSGVPFAPLSVILNGGVPSKRVEPDFVLYKQGLTMIVEIDGDSWHTESPAKAHERLKFLTQEGVILERVESTECDTAPKASEAAARILRAFDKHRQAR